MTIRKLLFALLLLLLPTISSNAQTFAPIGAKWYYNSIGQGSAPFPFAEYYLYESVLDTAVSGHACKKITVTYYSAHNGIIDRDPIFTYQENDTVFYYNDIYSQYFPLYIFNVSVGDTVTYHAPNIPFNAADTLWHSVVDSVTSFVVDGDTLKRVWTTEYYPSAYSFWGGYIELLGNPFLMLHEPSSIILESDGPMRCYSDSSHFHSFISYPCDYRITSNVSNHTLLETLVYPNPIVDNVEISLEKPYKDVNIIVRDVLGRQVGAYYYNNTQKVRIELDMEQGVYLVEISTGDGKKAVKKILKQ